MRIGVGRRCEELFAGTRFHDATQVHHHDPVAHVRDRAQVVRDEDKRGIVLRLNGAQQIEHLSPDGDVQRRHRFVANDHGWQGHEGARNRCALLLPPG